MLMFGIYKYTTVNERGVKLTIHDINMLDKNKSRLSQDEIK